MSRQPTTNPAPDDRPPWTPVSVAIISFFLPAGGAVVTIRNLHRLRELDPRATRDLSVAVVLIFALGLTALISFARRSATGAPSLDTSASGTLQFGVALVSFLCQRAPFRTWRLSNGGTRTSSWTGAVGQAALYTLITVLATLPLYTMAQLLGIGTPIAGVG